MFSCEFQNTRRQFSARPWNAMASRPRIFCKCGSMSRIIRHVVKLKPIKVTGAERYQQLASNGFEAEFLGHHKPPAAHYRLTDPGIEFYAEFVAPLAGRAVSRRGRPKATQRVGGISTQNLRYVEVFL